MYTKNYSILYLYRYLDMYERGLPVALSNSSPPGKRIFFGEWGGGLLGLLNISEGEERRGGSNKLMKLMKLMKRGVCVLTFSH